MRALVLSFAVALWWSAIGVAQVNDARGFLGLSNQPNVETSCGFRVRSNENATLQRRGYILRLPDWTLTVSQLTGLGVTNAAVDLTLDQAADLLKVDQGGTDVNCCVDMRRQGTIGNFAAPAGMVNGVITTQAESNAVFAINADIKIVTNIQFCGVAGQFAGCADGSSIIVVNGFNPPATNTFTDPVTVAHEAGHWAGLGHVAQTCQPTSGQCGTGPNACSDCTDGFSNRVMYCRICAGAPNQGVITANQCNSWQTNTQ